MPRIPSNMLRAGMLLTRDATNLHGHLLLGTGHVVQESDLFLLASWGIREVEVDASGSPPDNSVPDEVLDRIERELKTRFIRQDLEQVVIQELWRACLDCRLREEVT